MTQAEQVSAPVGVAPPPPSQQTEHPLQHGVVKNVLSGDCVIIRPLSPSGPLPERTLAFSNITAPRLERRPTLGGVSETKDEPYAWEAREFVRSRTVGQTVAFCVENSVNNRDYGVIFLGNNREAENLTHSLINEGLVEVRRANNRVTPFTAELCMLEDKAKAATKGKWNPDTLNDHVRDVKWSAEPLRQWVDARKGTTYSGIIEHVRDGSTVRLILLPDFYYITVALSGVKTPGFQFDQSTQEQNPEPLAEEAKSFIETRLLHREVKVIIEGLTGNTIMASIHHLAKGNIAPYLLEAGLAKIVDWSLNSISASRDVYQAAERKAKLTNKGVWKDYVSPQFPVTKNEGDNTFTAVVVEINTADSITILRDEEEMKIKFSSVRGPRLDDNKPRGKSFRPLYQIPCMFEAREFLRQRLIGERVLVSVDYVQPANEGFPESTCCTVMANGHNIAEALISKGLATVIRHRKDDDQRSRAWDDLVNAESKATKDRVGLHDPNKSLIRVSDICGEIKLARNFYTGLTKGLVPAVVEHVVAASRVRLYVKSATCVLSFLLAGINAPKASRTINNVMSPAEPFGEEARTFARRSLLHRDVQVKVEAMDKVGNFIGYLFVKDGSKSFNALLVQNGFASVHNNVSDRHEQYPELSKAEKEAKEAVRGVWSVPGFQAELAPEVEPDEVDLTPGVERRINTVKAVCTEVGENLNFYVQHVQDGHQVECLMSNLQANIHNMVPAALTSIRAGDVVAARFSLDKQWYRAKVERKTGDKYAVFYVDYGNRESISSDDICQLPTEFSLSAFPPHCHQYQLAFAKLAPRDDLKTDGSERFAQQVLNKTFDINVEYKLGGVNAVTVLLNDESTTDLGKSLVKTGYLLAAPRKEPKFSEITNAYQDAEKHAKTNRLNMWCYGDITEDENFDRMR